MTGALGCVLNIKHVYVCTVIAFVYLKTGFESRPSTE